MAGAMQAIRPLRKRQRLIRINRIRQSQSRRDAEGRATCMNCGALLTGPFCHVCGQKDGDVRRPIWSLLSEILDDVFSADSRIIKSILMLVLVPGGLTRSFMSGQRAAYVMPVKLYVAVSLLFFLILGVSNVAIIDLAVVPKDGAEIADNIGDDTDDADIAADLENGENIDDFLPKGLGAEATEVVNAEIARAQAISRTVQSLSPPEPPGDAMDAEAMAEFHAQMAQWESDLQARIETLPRNLREALAEEDTAVQGRAVKIFDQLMTAVGDNIPLGRARDAIGGAIARNMDRLDQLEEQDIDVEDLADINVSIGDSDLQFAGINFGNYDVSVGAFVRIDPNQTRGFTEEDAQAFLENNREEGNDEVLVQNVLRILERPDAFNELFNDWLPYALFILMPLFALMLRVTHWGGRRVYLHQLVFSLHFHSFLFLLMITFVVFAGQWDGPTMAVIFWVGTSLYLIIALKVGQNQGWIRAFLKAGFLWVGYFILLTLGLGGAVGCGVTESCTGSLY